MQNLYFSGNLTYTTRTFSRGGLTGLEVRGRLTALIIGQKDFRWMDGRMEEWLGRGMAGRKNDSARTDAVFHTCYFTIYTMWLLG